MANRHLPVRPNLDALDQQAQTLLRGVHKLSPTAVKCLQQHSISKINPQSATLNDARDAVARSYGVENWSRLVLACRMTDAIWRDDANTVRELITQHPQLIHEDARGVNGNWGPPMSYAANLGRNDIIEMLHRCGATDLQHAFDRACLQGHIETARKLYAMGARPEIDSVMGPCETQNGAGLALLLELGAAISDQSGNSLAPVALVLETYCRNPDGKHQCLELFAQTGIELPDTPPMAIHRGRIDLLENHLRCDSNLFSRTFTHQEIYPPQLGCHSDESLALHGTPLAGATLLHLCIDYGEIDIARWMIEHGADVNATAEIDPEGFGGHTPLFSCVVSQPYRVGLCTDDSYARLLLENGADLHHRASLRKRLRFVEDESMHEYRDVSPRQWGEQFHDQSWVNQPATNLIRQFGG